MTLGSTTQHLARLSGYMMLGFMANNAAQLIEVVYLGVVGTKELAAIAFTFPVTFALHAIGRGIAAGAASLMARARGAGRTNEVLRTATHCLLLTGIYSVLCIGAGFAWAESFYALLGAQNEVLAMALSYSVIWLIGFPIFVLGTVASLLLRGVGSGAAPGVVMVSGSVLQIVLGPFLIFGWLGAPALGIEGAALSFVISRSVSFAIAIYWITYRDRLLTVHLGEVIATWRAILHIGVPAALNNLIPPVSAAIVTRLLASHGDLVVAGFGVATRIEMLFWMIMAAVATSTGPIVGQNWGAGLYTRVRESMRTSYLFCLGWGVFSLVVMLMWVEPMVAIIKNESTIIEIATEYLVIIALSLGFVGIQNTASFCFNALGKPGPALVLSIFRLIILYVPMAIAANYWFGYIGVFWATAIANVIAGAVSWIWARSAISPNSDPGTYV